MSYEYDSSPHILSDASQSLCKGTASVFRRVLGSHREFLGRLDFCASQGLPQPLRYAFMTVVLVCKEANRNVEKRGCISCSQRGGRQSRFPSEDRGWACCRGSQAHTTVIDDRFVEPKSDVLSGDKDRNHTLGRPGVLGVETLPSGRVESNGLIQTRYYSHGFPKRSISRDFIKCRVWYPPGGQSVLFTVINVRNK